MIPNVTRNITWTFGLLAEAPGYLQENFIDMFRIHRWFQSLVNLNQVATKKGTIVNVNPVNIFYSSFHYSNTVVKLGSFEHLDLFDSCFRRRDPFPESQPGGARTFRECLL